MNVVRERILIGIKPYLAFAEHKDLISFCVPSDVFEDYEDIDENNGEPCADFNELIVVVEKDWLFNQIRSEGIDNPLNYLQTEYSSDDGYEWFVEAKSLGKVVVVAFN